MENINKSIIYGNIHQNKYGKFLPICSSINDRSTFILTKTTWPPSFSISTKACILKNTIELPMPTESKKFQSCLSQRKKILNPNTMRILTVIKLLKAPAKNFFICYKNLVFFLLFFIDIKNVFIACLIQQFNPLLPF